MTCSSGWTLFASVRNSDDTWTGSVAVAICLARNKCGTEQTVVNRSVTYRELVYNSQTGGERGREERGCGIDWLERAWALYSAKLNSTPSTKLSSNVRDIVKQSSNSSVGLSIYKKKSFVMASEISGIAQFRVTMAAKCGVLTCSVKVYIRYDLTLRWEILLRGRPCMEWGVYIYFNLSVKTVKIFADGVDIIFPDVSVISDAAHHIFLSKRKDIAA